MTTASEPQAGEWDPWGGITPGVWEDCGTFQIDREWYDNAVKALEFSDEALRALGDYVHPGVLALDILPRLSQHFRTNEPDPSGGERPDRPRVVSLHLRQRCRMEGPIRIGEQLKLIGRIVDRQMGARPTLVRQAWIFGEDGTPRFFYQQTSRLSEPGRMKG